MSPKKFDLDAWDDEEATDAADRLDRTAGRVDAERQALTEQALAERIEAAVSAARPGADKIPDPVDPEGDGDLSPEEQERLNACIEGIELLSTATWVAGKSLDTVATGRLFRQLPHKLEPERCYQTIEEWAVVEYGISRSRCSQLRDGWQLGEVLVARGYKAPEGQVRELTPLVRQHGLKAAVGLYEMAVAAVGATKVTAARLREAVSLLPGDLTIPDEDDVTVIAQKLAAAVENAERSSSKTSAVSPELRKETTRSLGALAKQLGRESIPRSELQVALLTLFVEDKKVFSAVKSKLKGTK